jgi:hypothetical protein
MHGKIEERTGDYAIRRYCSNKCGTANRASKGIKHKMTFDGRRRLPIRNSEKRIAASAVLVGKAVLPLSTLAFDVHLNTANGGVLFCDVTTIRACCVGQINLKTRK